MSPLLPRSAWPHGRLALTATGLQSVQRDGSVPATSWLDVASQVLDLPKLLNGSALVASQAPERSSSEQRSLPSSRAWRRLASMRRMRIIVLGASFPAGRRCDETVGGLSVHVYQCSYPIRVAAALNDALCPSSECVELINLATMGFVMSGMLPSLPTMLAPYLQAAGDETPNLVLLDYSGNDATDLTQKALKYGPSGSRRAEDETAATVEVAVRYLVSQGLAVLLYESYGVSPVRGQPVRLHRVYQRVASHYGVPHRSGWSGPSTLSEATARSVSLHHAKAPGSPAHPRAPPELRGSLPRPQQPAPACSQDDELLRSNHQARELLGGLDRPRGRMEPRLYLAGRRRRVHALHRAPGVADAPACRRCKPTDLRLEPRPC